MKSILLKICHLVAKLLKTTIELGIYRSLMLNMLECFQMIFDIKIFKTIL